MEGPFLNSYVINRSVQGLGWDTHTIWATKEDLLKLASEIAQEASKDGSVEVTRFASIAHGRTNRVQITFRDASREQITELHTTNLTQKILSAMFFLVVAGIVTLSFVGLISLIK